MCPFIALVVLFQLIVLVCDVTSVSIDFKSPLNETDVKIQLKEGGQQAFNYSLDEFDSKARLAFDIQHPAIADVDRNFVELYQVSERPYQANLVVKGKYVGFTQLDVSYEATANQTNSRTLLKRIGIVVTVNENKKLSSAFTIMVIILVSLNTVNMGCALDTDVILQTIKRPTALLIGFFTHYFFMPVLAFVIGLLLFEDVPYLRLSLFIFGCSPGGTGANMWTVLLNGNLNLSVTMTFLSTLLAAGLTPLWLFTLGLQIFRTNSLRIPYRDIFLPLILLLACIGIGLVIQKWKPKLAQKSKRILAPVCGLLIAFIVIFASIVYWYLFKLITWKIFLAAILNVWLGFAVGAVFAWLFRQKTGDLISIMVETGIQNTGIVFVIIRFALDPPYSDFAMTIPVASSIVTAVPLTILFIFFRCRSGGPEKNKLTGSQESIPIAKQQSYHVEAN